MTDHDDGMTLAERTARLLILAGVRWNHPQLRRIREHNSAAYARAGLPSPHDGAAPP